MVDNYTHIFVTMSYSTRAFKVKVSMDRRVSVLKEEAYNLFYPLQGKVVLLFRAKDIAPYDDMTIGQFFKGIQNVSIVVKDNTTSLKKSSDKDKEKKAEAAVNRTMIVDSKLKLNSIIETGDSSNNVNRSLQELDRSQLLNQQEGDTSQINMTSLLPLDANTSVRVAVNQRMICFDCKKVFIYFFCRECNNFICKPCKERMQLAHFNHEVVRVLAEDIPKGVNAYLATLSSELKKSKKQYDLFDKQFTTIRDLDKWEAEIKGKIDLIEEMSQDVIAEAKQPNYDIEREVKDIRDSMGVSIDNSSPTSIDIFEKLSKVDQYVGTVLKKATDFVSVQNKKKRIDQMVQPINAELDKILKQLQSEQGQ